MATDQKKYCFNLWVTPIWFVVALLLHMHAASAQDGPCSQDDLMNKKGGWKQKTDFFQPPDNYTPAMKPEIMKRLNAMHELVRQAYSQPMGAEAFWYREIMGYPLNKKAPVPYSLSHYLLEYYCSDREHRWKLDEEYMSDVMVHVNSFAGFLHFDTSMKVGHYYVAQMAVRVGKLKGTDLFQLSLVRGNERYIIIARDGQLPYIPLTRKQYLDALREKFERARDDQVKGVQEHSLEDENARKKHLEYVQHMYDRQFNQIGDYFATHSEDDLNQVACTRNSDDCFFTPEEKGGRMEVIFNGKYFNKELPLWVPQFILVYWTWNDGEGPGGGLLRPVPPDMNVCCKVAKNFKEKIEQNLDVDALRKLIDQ